ncbi:MAG TPA: endonuclease/exonuclease/phosphatase family protein [Pirellulales bacterium]|nr:endonuclease/exonuclease/phosphatase family protein [Pirellulales bacterium]
MAHSVASPVRLDTSQAALSPRRPGRGARLLWLAVLCLSLVWAGYRRTPCGSEAGTAFSSPAARKAQGSEKPTFRVATFNIHGGEGPDGRLDLERTAESLRDFDLVALNEVYGRNFWEAAGQAEILGRLTQRAWLFAPSEHRWGHDHFGNASLTSLEVQSWQRMPLPRNYGHSCRNLLLAAFAYRGQTVRAVMTHLDRSDDRDRNRQLQLVAELFLGLAEPAILMGDMNTTADEPAMKRLLATPGVGDPLAEIMREKTPRRIDWILTRGLEAANAGLVDSGASDHPCVWVELRLPGDVTGPAR